MRLKKVLALALAGVMAAGLVGCGGSDDKKESETTKEAATTVADAGEDTTEAPEADTQLDDKLVVWTLAADLEQFAKKFEEANAGTKVEVLVIAPEDYPTKVSTALLGGQTEPDVIVGEPQMLPSMIDQGFFANLDELGAQDYADKIVDYVWETGQDADGVQRAISYQITPAGFYYRRDIASKVFGTDDPDEIGKLFADYPTILKTAQTLKDAGYKIFASDAETNYFSGDEAWVIDGKLNLSQARLDYMDLCVELYTNEYTAFANQWTAPWYAAMSGPVPVLTAEIAGGVWDEDEDGNPLLNVWDAENFNANIGNYTDETTEVFAYGLPAWGVLTLRDNVKDTSGSWGVCAGPAYGFGGGTYIGVSELSERKATAWEFVKFCTLNEETAEWWIEASEGDTVSYIPTLEKHADDANEVYGGEKLYAFWLEQAKGIDLSKVTEYDKTVGDAWGQAISAVKTGEKSKEEAIEGFYTEVSSAYPDLIIEK